MPAMDFYTRKRVWITGASSGLGKELARQMLRAGARVVLTARNTAALEESAAGAPADRFRLLPGDMEALDSLPALAESAWQAFGGLDMVIYNAGVSHRSTFIETAPETGGRVLAVNLLSQIELTRHLLPLMVSAGGGHIVSVTSLAGRVASPLRSYYSAAKHALHGFFSALRVETARSGVCVSLVVPGFLKTDISKHALTGDGGFWNRSDRNQLSGIDPARAAAKVLKKLPRHRREIYVGYPLRAALALFLGTRFPVIFDRALLTSDHT